VAGDPRLQNLVVSQTIQNGVECISGVLVVQDVVQNPEQQSRKVYHGDISALPDKSTIPAHTAEVLRLVEGANIPEVGWVGGDSWFGSVTTAIEVIIFVFICTLFSNEILLILAYCLLSPGHD